jgi:hypothetical protein
MDLACKGKIGYNEFTATLWNKETNVVDDETMRKFMRLLKE